MGQKQYAMGRLNLNSWRGNDAQQLTFVVTQDCNLRCGYCYMTDKNDRNVMSFDTAKKIVDYFVDNREELYTSDYLILDFIGGEPLLEIELIDQIVDYFILSTYQKHSKWFGRFRIMIQSNGVLVDKPEVQRFLKKNRKLLSLGITIDGTREKHDFHRVFPNGKGSYEIVEKNYKMAVQQGYTDGTKVTFGSGDLHCLKESIIHLWSMGISNVPANIVYEDVWKDGDDAVYYDQLISLADHIIDNRLWNIYNTTLFSDCVGFKAEEETLMHPICGTGNMYCVDANGDIYNCIRFMSYSLNGKDGKKIGDINRGVDKDKIRPLKTLMPKYLSEERCLDCRINQNCLYCSGNNYNMSDNDSMFYRATAICKMFQAQVKANNYYWARLFNEYSIRRDVPYKHEYFMYFILASDSVHYCKFKKSEKVESREIMKPEDLIRGLAYAYENFYQPVFVHSDDSTQWLRELESSKEYGKSFAFEQRRHIIRHIVRYGTEFSAKEVIYVMDENTDCPQDDLNAPVILNVCEKNISDLAKRVEDILPYTSRIVINISDLDKNFPIAEYDRQLEQISALLYGYLSKGKQKEIRQLTDRIFARKMNNCFAGEKNITFAPDGEFYLCPAFYFDKTINKGREKSNKLAFLSSSPGCDNCDAYHCERCIYKNLIGTGELNIPTEIQCKVAYLEREQSRKLWEKLKKIEIFQHLNVNIPEVNGDDPIESLVYYNKTKAICN